MVVASRGGALRGIENVDIQKRLLEENLTEAEIEKVIDEYTQ